MYKIGVLILSYGFKVKLLKKFQLKFNINNSNPMKEFIYKNDKIKLNFIKKQYVCYILLDNI